MLDMEIHGMFNGLDRLLSGIIFNGKNYPDTP